MNHLDKIKRINELRQEFCRVFDTAQWATHNGEKEKAADLNARASAIRREIRELESL